MKKLILLFLLTTHISFSQTVNYTVDNSNFLNPERGFYQPTSSGWNGSLNALSTSTLNSYKSNGNSTILREWYLNSYMNLPIPIAYLTSMQNDFNTIRNAGMKCIIRFAYSKDDSAGVIYNPNKAQILSHISQIATVLQANQDVIMCVQLGWLGAWGEWDTTVSSATSEFCNTVGNYTSWNTACWNNRKEVTQAFMDVLPTKYYQIRMPSSKMAMYGNTTLNNFGTTYKERLGHHNDCFLSSADDYWTYIPSSPIGGMTQQLSYVSQETLYTPNGGETCSCYIPRGNFTSANSEMRNLHYTYLNEDYNTTVLAMWDTGNCSSSTPSGPNFDLVKKNLGYRLTMNSSTISNNIFLNTDFNFQLSLTNSGYAAPFNKREVQIVFKNTTTNIEYKKTLTTDIRTWSNSININETIINNLPIGSYQLYLFIPDYSTNLVLRPEYSIRCANIGTWVASKGYNDLLQTINIIAPTGCTTTTWNGVVWSNGLPLSSKTAIIVGDYDTSNDGSIDCCDLIINNGGNLIITSGEYCSVSGDITVDNFGTCLVKSGGSLIPISPTCISTGIVNVERKTTPVKRYDYTYWSSPVSCSIENSLLPIKWESNHTYTFNTSNFYDVETRYQNTFISNLPDGQDDNDDAWTNSLPSDVMVKAKGYASMVKSLISTGTYPRIETVNFVGQLNTGVITTPIELSANALESNDDMNLVGNPYSAAASSDDFIDDNITNISGTLYFWTHTNTLSTSYSGLEMFNFSVNDYARYTKLGGVTATFGGKKPSNVIGSCQGFFIEAENNANLVFNPSLLSKAYVNTTSVAFFRTTEINKVWLNISTELGLFAQQLIGYRDDSTLEYDKGFDSKLMSIKTPIEFYSIENGNKYDIQARGTYDINDVVKLGYETAVAETYTISIDDLDNINNVYIKDNGVLHNLPYTFTSEIGEFNDRFELVYNNLLSTDIPAANSEIVVYPNPTNNNLYIKNFKGKILKVYDILGKTYKIEYTNYNENTIIVNTNTLNRGLYLLRLDNKTIRFIKK
jgi:hypothetical protein